MKTHWWSKKNVAIWQNQRKLISLPNQIVQNSKTGGQMSKFCGKLWHKKFKLDRQIILYAWLGGLGQRFCFRKIAISKTVKKWSPIPGIEPGPFRWERKILTTRPYRTLGNWAFAFWLAYCKRVFRALQRIFVKKRAQVSWTKSFKSNMAHLKTWADVIGIWLVVVYFLLLLWVFRSYKAGWIADADEIARGVWL